MTEKVTLTSKEWSQRFSNEPFNITPSYEPYAVADHPDAAATREELLRDFFTSSEEQWPDLGDTYPNLSKTGAVHPEAELQRLLSEADRLADPVEADLLYEQAATKLAELYRHRQITRMLGHSGIKQENARTEAANMTLEIFGTPEKDAYISIIDVLRNKARQFADKSPIAQELLSLLGSVESERVALGVELSDETIDILRSDIVEIFPGIEKVLVAEDAFETISGIESLPHFQRMIDFLGMDGWVAVSKAGKGVETSAKLKQIRVGLESNPFSPQVLNGLMGHEVMGHGLRSFNALRHEKEMLHGLLPGALEFEEGWGMALQQIISGRKVAAGTTHYLSLGLQLGLDREDGKTRGFRDTYEILWRRTIVDALANGEQITDEIVEDAKALARRNVVRTTRGGALDARDISYFEGARKANELLNKIAKSPKADRVSRIKWLSSARFDPTNPRHVAAVGEAA